MSRIDMHGVRWESDGTAGASADLRVFLDALTARRAHPSPGAEEKS